MADYWDGLDRSLCQDWLTRPESSLYRVFPRLKGQQWIGHFEPLSKTSLTLPPDHSYSRDE